MMIRFARDTDHQRWDEYVLNHKAGTAYHLFSWKTAIEKTYKFKCFYLMAEESGAIVGVLPLVQQGSQFRRSHLFSLPYCDIGGILSDSVDTGRSLLAYALEYMRKNGFSKLDIRTNKIDLQESSGKKSAKVRMLMEMEGNAESLMRSFKSKLRSQVRKTFRDGLQVRIGGIELLDTFYRVFAENMRDLGSPVHSKNWFSQILKAYGARSRCGVVYLPDGRPAAGGIILLHEYTLSIPWASHLRKLNQFNPNMLLYWRFLEFAADNGYKFFDFGRSTPEEGTYNFKAQWGAIPEPLFWYRWKVDDKGVINENGASNSHVFPKFRPIAERVIQQMPISIATFLGSRIRKYISL